MNKYVCTVRTSSGTVKITIEARNPSQAKEIACAHGQVLSVVAG